MDHERGVDWMVELDECRGMKIAEGLNKGLDHLSEQRKRGHRLDDEDRNQDHEADDDLKLQSDEMDRNQIYN